VLVFLDLPIDEAELAAVVRSGEFGAMQALERRTGIDGQRHDRSDPEALRMRRGRIGGYEEYLSPDDVAEITEMCRKRLSPAARVLFDRQGLAI
jgi:alcohol sulfotransferase